ncbi:hypothetical protein LPB260_18035 [Pseudomonas sp. LPB0260]|uniref:hypothetical protein n=1 Tax=Pseudomonas sp. LPB0260 TaxID=2614442 RepID=UPI0015C21241|nr:hypothetical protein LPB260_03085 [Pseudomonas sp. LPB0260]QLC75435.1 hypothetical protein LPB260_18035 [Pseudomonas sp. LPB0260]
MSKVRYTGWSPTLAQLPERYGFTVQFHLASHRGRQPSEAQQAFETDLLAAFA